MRTKIWYIGGKEPVEVDMFDIDAKDAMARFPDQYVRELPGKPAAPAAEPEGEKATTTPKRAGEKG